MKLERNEYPRPQFRRENWQSLNGEWNFDFGEKDFKKLSLNRKINVPFSYQYEASGINDKELHEIVWYQRKFVIEKDNRSRHALLCFNAVDYETDVWINGYHVTTHIGGFIPFNVDITKYLIDGENEIVVRCKDAFETTFPRGKQSWTGEQFTCFYYPNSGIWQSVWIEFFDEDCINQYYLKSNIDERRILGHVETLYGTAQEIEITLKFKEKFLKKQRLTLDGKRTNFSISLANEAFDFSYLLWSIEQPNLISVEFELLKDEIVIDKAYSRIGLRKISIDEYGKLCLNNRPLFQRLILDQGYWNESGLTPPNTEALKRDIELAKAMGFNGARKHQKIEDPYFYYYAEELGFLVWCEMPSAYTFCESEAQSIIKQWQDIVNYAKNFTSIIAYVPLNESWGVQEIKTDKAQQNFAKSLYYLTKSLDDARVVSTNDGFETIEESDILGIHDYDIKRSEEFLVKYNGNYNGLHPQGFALFADKQKYREQPVLLTEFGGIAFISDQKDKAWGYGNGAKDEDELCLRINELIQGISKTEFQGYCYTQLSDVQQEVNGLLYADRTPKVPLEQLKKIFEMKKN